MTEWLSRNQCRQADRFAIEQLGIPGIVLMENAGRGCAEWLLSLGAENGGVTICCGGGNNGGDGFVIARHLHLAGIPCKIVLFSPPEKYCGDAKTNLQIVEKMKLPVVLFDPNWSDQQAIDQFLQVDRRSSGWLVDALLGTGATGGLRAPLDRVVPIINRLPVKRMAVDIPTGMDADTGEVHPTAIVADITCTFIARKIGFQNKSAWPYLGHVTVVGIGA